ncbi:hypothetical protein ABEI56_05745 [Peribacillus castrilensis]|nr:hypothetical protein [Peribacillus frigoritolerans]MCK2018286.1 hypothetical protein [Peribacillus frigoritolerans]
MKELFTNIYKKNRWRNSESVSGSGSSLTQTKTHISGITKHNKTTAAKKG